MTAHLSARQPRDPLVRVGLTQMPCDPDPAVNRDRQRALIHAAADQGAQVICTQELFTSQYFCQTEDHRFFELAEPIPGPTTDALAAVARDREIVIIASLFEKRAAGLYHNTAAIIDADGTLLGVYRKMHIPDDPLYYEKFYFTPGDGDFRAWNTRYARIGVLICWDQWFPEAARLTALHGAELLFYPTAIGWHASEKAEFGQAQYESWEIIQRSHAIANGCYVCAPNRCGREQVTDADGHPVHPDGIEFWGQSFVAAPDGQLVDQAPAGEPATVVVPCDLSRVEFARTHWPFFRDRRVDAYGALTQRYRDPASESPA